jgi:hypothetical protein
MVPEARFMAVSSRVLFSVRGSGRRISQSESFKPDVGVHRNHHLDDADLGFGLFTIMMGEGDFDPSR